MIHYAICLLHSPDDRLFGIQYTDLVWLGIVFSSFYSIYTTRVCT